MCKLLIAGRVKLVEIEISSACPQGQTNTNLEQRLSFFLKASFGEYILFNTGIEFYLKQKK